MRSKEFTKKKIRVTIQLPSAKEIEARQAHGQIYEHSLAHFHMNDESDVGHFQLQPSPQKNGILWKKKTTSDVDVTSLLMLIGGYLTESTPLTGSCK